MLGQGVPQSLSLKNSIDGSMNPLLRSAIRRVLRPAARRACEAQGCSQRERAVAEVERLTRAHLRAQGPAAPPKKDNLPMYSGGMCGLLLALVIHLFKPREKSSQEIWLEIKAKSRGGSGAN